MTQNHPSSDSLQQFMDGELDAPLVAGIRRHLDECERCASAVRTLVMVDAALKGMPPEKTSPGFTRTVLGSLQLTPASPLTFRVLEKAGYVAGLVIVLGIMLGVFLLTGVIQSGQVEQGADYAGRILTQVDGAATGLISGLTEFLSKYMPFAFGKGSVGIVTFSVLFLILLAIADKILGGKVQHRLR